MYGGYNRDVWCVSCDFVAATSLSIVAAVVALLENHRTSDGSDNDD